MGTAARSSKADTLIGTVVAEFVDAIEAGSERWEMPWQRLGPDVLAPTNAVTGRRYRGGNRWSLALAAMVHGLEGGSWATYRQWQDIGAQVRKGERALAAVLVPREHQRTEIHDETGEETVHTWVDFRAAVVFHSSQVEGWQPTGGEFVDQAPIARAEELLADWRNAGMAVIEGGDSAYYDRRADTVHVPARGQFADIEHFYSTTAHEATHWTGAASRLGRHSDICRFGDDAYAAEELVAELGAAVVGAEVGIGHATRDDHAAYLAHWVRILRQDPRHLWAVAGDAEAAADYLLDLGADQ
jgi:antirestriction protein ArdC